MSLTSKELIEILNKTRRTKDISLLVEQIEELVKSLEKLERYEKIFNDPLIKIRQELEETKHLREQLQKERKEKRRWKNKTLQQKEILEILRKAFNFRTENDIITYFCDIEDIWCSLWLEKEKNEKIKQWLEADKNG